MGEHELIEPDVPAEPPRDVSRVIEWKVVIAALVTLLASVAFAVLNAVLADSSILGGLPGWLQFLILAAAPPVLAFLAGYRVPSNRV